MQPIPPPTAPFQQIGMDLLGPFPPSTSGNRWIIVATDYLTRYAETKALPSGTAVEVAKFFIESIVLRHGAPEVLITDRGSSFMAQLTQEILRLSHTSHRRTNAYHPQTNGLTERLNKTIADMISMYVDVEHKTWDEVLPYVTFAYNTAVQETTGFTPFQLVHGRKVTTMLDAMLPHEPADNESDDAQVVAQRAEEVCQLARLLIQDQQRVDAGRYNLRRRDVHFQPGERVWVWTPIRRRGPSEKLLKRYFGPFKVTLCVLTHHAPTPPKNEVSILNPPAVSINCAHPGAHHETSPTHHGLKTAPPVEAYKEDRAMELLRGHGGTAMATTLSPSIFFVQVTLCVLTHHVPTPLKNEVSILNPPAVSINCAHPGAHHETSPTHHGLKTAPPVEAYKDNRAVEFLRGHGGTAMATTLSPSIFFVQVTLCVLTHHVPTPPKNEVSILNPPAVSINCAHPGAHHETSPTHHGLKTAPPVEAYKEDRAMEFLRGHGGTAMATTLSPSIFFVQVTGLTFFPSRLQIIVNEMLRSGTRLPTVTSVAVAGGVLTETLAQLAVAAFHNIKSLKNIYGMSECCGCVCVSPVPGISYADVGVPGPTVEIKYQTLFYSADIAGIIISAYAILHNVGLYVGELEPQAEPEDTSNQPPRPQPITNPPASAQFGQLSERA
ncbi:uncharacterized protein ISCGN_010478 [Ixodes scapularis]